MGDMSFENVGPLFDEEGEDIVNDPQAPQPQPGPQPQPQPQPQPLPLPQPQPLPVPQLEANANRRRTRSTLPPAEPTDPLTKRKSVVWREFETVKGLFYPDGKDRARCKHCKVKAYPSASNNGTTNFKNHLDKCEAYAAYQQAEAAGDGPCEPFRFEQRIYHQKVAKAIICHGLLQEHLKNRDPVIKEIVERMWSKFGKYWSEYTMIFAFALILDPRHKTVTIKKCYKKLYKEPEATLKEGEVLSKLRLLFAEYERDTVPPTNVITSTSASILLSPPRKRTFNYRDELDEDEDSSSVVGPSSLLDRYLQEPKLGRNDELDILDFWKGKAEEYKELSLMARDILSVPLTTVASESTFSIGGRVLDK